MEGAPRAKKKHGKRGGSANRPAVLRRREGATGKKEKRHKKTWYPALGAVEKKPTAPVAEHRTRGLYDTLPDENKRPPHCSHGPCLLFGRREEPGGPVVEKFYACAVFRTREVCAFRAPEDSLGPEGRAEIDAKRKKTQYGRIIDSLQEIGAKRGENTKKKRGSDESGEQTLFCHTCLNVFDGKHQCPASTVTREQLEAPSQLLTPFHESEQYAQYWFSDSTLAVLSATLKSAQIDGALCVASPRAFQHLKSQGGTATFMLDADERYAAFYRDSEFAAYSALVDWFYDPEAERRLVEFLKNVKRLAIVCDPPFGVLLQQLAKSINKLKARHQSARGNQKSESFLLLYYPYYNEKHASAAFPGLKMSDFRVTYTNHRVFGSTKKSIVRLYTDLEPSQVDLSVLESEYRECPMCERWVVQTNKHCGVCGDCTMREGVAPYKHCERCRRCVKPIFRHCKVCNHCHRPEKCPQKSAEQAAPEEKPVDRKRKRHFETEQQDEEGSPSQDRARRSARALQVRRTRIERMGRDRADDEKRKPKKSKGNESGGDEKEMTMKVLQKVLAAGKTPHPVEEFREEAPVDYPTVPLPRLKKLPKTFRPKNKDADQDRMDENDFSEGRTGGWPKQAPFHGKHVLVNGRLKSFKKMKQK